MKEHERQKLIEYEEKRKAKLEKMNAESIAMDKKIEAMIAKQKEKRDLKKKKADEFKGYYYDHDRNKYRVQFSFNGKRYRLGSYNTHWEAHAIYLEERAKLESEAKKAYYEYEKEIAERAERIKAQIKAQKEAEENEIFVIQDPEHDGDYEEEEKDNSDTAPF